MKLKLYTALVLSLSAMFAAGWHLARAPKVTHAKWDGERFVCPANTDQWADEKEALAEGRNFVYCISEGSR